MMQLIKLIFEAYIVILVIMMKHSVIRKIKGKENFKSLEQSTRISILQMATFSLSPHAFHSCISV